ncbi:tryptophan halogenase family protein [Jidongwangia harbinensis]|uniref:tryptophan halogenase family protein n=1 Tax=Jidongwangia harbinensis TaxID=2878561 RepID=UPI001CD9FE35|nr:tryptophan halogenase family protein [Jidongwangia harbinensis]MCA2211679.1 tryptophan 7-halogenase [Jidongwangia harbinensis]
MTRTTPPESLIGALSADEAEALRAWLGGRDGAVNLTGVLRDHERPVDDPARPRDGDPHAVRSVGVIGGGTAGYLTALALRARRPWLDVTLVESSAIPIIGVGEATVPSMLLFLHHYLGIDPADLYKQVRPTWKLGIRFDWGPDPRGFMAPFDWGANSVGLLGSLATQQDINAASLLSLMMAADRTPVLRAGGELISLLPYLPFAYHLDNATFVDYLVRLARERGVRHVDAKLATARRRDSDWIDHLLTEDGERLEFDLYVDCTGFRSMLLGDALETPFQSFGDSLWTDSAVTGNRPHGGHLKPYTTATTMSSGWCWTIPTPDSDHHGYVYASGALSDDEAAAELARRFPGVGTPRQVRFRSGRRERAWRGNVMAIGNSYGFVEPLESSGLLMITLSAMSLISALPASWSDPISRDVVNAALAAKWDAIRWFLSIHYKFNTKFDTPFWTDVRARADISGLQPLVDAYAAGAPLRFRDPVIRGFLQSTSPTFYGLPGIDCLLLGQRVPTRLLPSREPIERWRARKAAADALVAHALPQHEALAAVESEAWLNAELFSGRDSWAGPSARVQLV